ncbi:unnamed protein product [Urochloa humidicola]
MGKLGDMARAFSKNRWLVFVAAMWVQSMAGTIYMFGAISPVLKARLGYDQRQLAALGVAKNAGGCLGLLAGAPGVAAAPRRRRPELPRLRMPLARRRRPHAAAAPLADVCGYLCWNKWPDILQHGFTCYNHPELPKEQGANSGHPERIYGPNKCHSDASICSNAHARPCHTYLHDCCWTITGFHWPFGLMFVIRPVGGHRQVRPSDKNSFMFINTVCLLLASYLVGAMLVQDFLEPSYDVVVFLTLILFILLISPIAIPVILSLTPEKDEHPIEDALLPESFTGDASTSQEKEDQPEVFLSEVEEEKPKDTDTLPPSERRKRIAELQAQLVQAAARGGVRVKRRLHRGDNFTLTQAFLKADFWIIWISFLLGSGSGLTVIDNLGQMSQVSGFKNAHIFVSLMSIWNFLGRVGGGYFSEIIVRERTYPRHIALTFAQIVMAAGHFLFAMAWPGTMYIASLLVGLAYGAHCAIVPAAVSELFGVKHFGEMYNFLILANPTGSFIFSGLIVSNLYDYEAEKQAHQHQMSALLSPRLLRTMSFLTDGPLKCEGPSCFFVSSLIMSVFCVIGAGLSLLVVHRTKRVYARLYSSVRT